MIRVPEEFDDAMQTDRGKARTVGFEIEYAGVPLWRTARIIQDLFGGDIEERSKAEWSVADTSLGTFRLEIDAEPVKKLVSGMSYESAENGDAIDRFLGQAADAAGDVVA